MPQKHTEILKDSLKAVYKYRKDGKAWIDEDSSERGILSTLEGLECFGSVAARLGQIKNVDKKYQVFKMEESIIQEDLDYILKTINDQGYPPSPYLDKEFAKQGVVYQKGLTDFVDTVSFFITCMLDLIAYYPIVYSKQIPRKEEIEIHVKDAIKWLIDNMIIQEDKAFWSWGANSVSDTIPSLYFTWSAIIGLTYALDSEDVPISDTYKQEITYKLNLVANWLCSILVKSGDEPELRCRVDYPGISEAEEGSPESLLIYWGDAISWLCDCSAEIPVEKRDLQILLFNLLNIFRNREFRRIRASGHVIRSRQLSGDELFECVYTDRSYKYLLLGVLCWYYKQNKESVIVLDDHNFDDLQRFIERQLNELLNNRISESGVWDRTEEDTFIIYLTQRAIEALLSYIDSVESYERREVSDDEYVQLATNAAIQELKAHFLKDFEKWLDNLQQTISSKYETMKSGEGAT